MVFLSLARYQLDGAMNKGDERRNPAASLNIDLAKSKVVPENEALFDIIFAFQVSE
jgi:hypothetical protein